jgi:hypothetical protein
MSKNIKDETLQEVSGGSWFITEEDGKKAGLTLRKENQQPGSWGYLYNEGDYYWNGQKLTPTEANAIVHYVKDHGFQPKTLQEALDKYN